MFESSSNPASQHHSTLLRGVVQLALPSKVTPVEIAREQSLGGSIELCAKVAGFSLDKELQVRLEADKAQFSRWLAGTEGIVWPKLRRLMDICGNHAPVLWMLHQLGYDLHSLRRRETELEAELRQAREQIAALEQERAVTIRVLKEIRA